MQNGKVNVQTDARNRVRRNGDDGVHRALGLPLLYVYYLSGHGICLGPSLFALVWSSRGFWLGLHVALAGFLLDFGSLMLCDCDQYAVDAGEFTVAWLTFKVRTIWRWWQWQCGVRIAMCRREEGTCMHRSVCERVLNLCLYIALGRCD